MKESSLHLSLKNSLNRDRLTFQRTATYRIPTSKHHTFSLLMRDSMKKPSPRRQLLPGVENDVLNYRLARARMVDECSFGNIRSQFKVLSVPIETKAENTVIIVYDILLLHNVIGDRVEFRLRKKKSLERLLHNVQ
jgi:hypothetical protein